MAQTILPNVRDAGRTSMIVDYTISVSLRKVTVNAVIDDGGDLNLTDAERYIVATVIRDNEVWSRNQGEDAALKAAKRREEKRAHKQVAA